MPNVLYEVCISCRLPTVKIFLRLVNIVPLFAALLILFTGWKLLRDHLAAHARRGSFGSAIAGAMAYQL